MSPVIRPNTSSSSSVQTCDEAQYVSDLCIEEAWGLGLLISQSLDTFARATRDSTECPSVVLFRAF
jgi:hypothetical protein